MRILVLISLIYPISSHAMGKDAKSTGRPATNLIEIPQVQSNAHHYGGESPNSGLALKNHILGKSVSPERARTPALPSLTDSDSPSKTEYTIYEQVITTETYMTALRLRVLEIFAHAREDKYVIGSKELHHRLTRHIRDEEKLLALLRKSPTPAELAAHLLSEPKESALKAWHEQGGGQLVVNSTFIKEKIKDTEEEIAATRIGLYINDQQLAKANCLQHAP